MKAVVYHIYGPPEVLQFAEVEKPVPKDNEVLVKIIATTVSAVDSIFRAASSNFARMATGVFKPKNPILGNELSGVVESIGKNVKRFKTGDHVFGPSKEGFGAHAEYICLPEDSALTKMPSNQSFEEAAAVPYGALTALPFLSDTAKLERGQQILIIGASGSVGTFAIQFARHFGAGITAVCSGANAALVQSLGADKVIDYTKADFTESGETYDVIFDTVGKSSFPKSKKSLKPGGVFMTTYISMAILFQMLWTSMAGSKKAKISFTGLRPDNEKAEDLLFIKKLIEADQLKSVIDRRYSLDQMLEAHHYVDQGHKKGNVVINVQDPMPG